MGFTFSFIKDCIGDNREVKWSTFAEKQKVRQSTKEVGIVYVARFPNYIDEAQMEEDLLGDEVWRQTFVYLKHHSVILKGHGRARVAHDTEEVKGIHSILVTKPWNFLRFAAEHVFYVFKAATPRDRDSWVRTLLFVEGKTKLKKSVQAENLEEVALHFKILYDLTTKVSVDYDLMRSSIIKGVLDFLRNKWEVSSQMQEKLLMMLPQMQKHTMPLDDIHVFIKKFLNFSSGSNNIAGCLKKLVPAILQDGKLDIHTTMLDLMVELMFSGKYCQESHFESMVRTLVASSDSKSYLAENISLALKHLLTVIRTILSQYENAFLANSIGCVLKDISAVWTCYSPDALGAAASHKLYEELAKLNRLTKFMSIMSDEPEWRMSLCANMCDIPKQTRALDNKYVNDILVGIIKKFALDSEPEMMSSLWKGDTVGWVQVLLGASPHNSKQCDDALFEILEVYGSKHIQESLHFYGQLKHFLSVLIRPQYASNTGVVKAFNTFLELRILSENESLTAMNTMMWSAEGKEYVHEKRRRGFFLHCGDYWSGSSGGCESNKYDFSGPYVHCLHKGYTDQMLVNYYSNNSHCFLHSLDCSNTEITGMIVPLLETFSKLKILALENTEFDDNGMKLLGSSSMELASLNIIGTKVTVSGCIEYQKTKPETIVTCSCIHGIDFDV